jgi:TPR repeat protein
VSHDVASKICQALRRGVTRSKRRSMQWLRTAAENGYADSCLQIADRMYADHPYAREVGHVGEAAGVPSSAGVMEGHDVPPDVLISVMLVAEGGAEFSHRAAHITWKSAGGG